MLGNPDVSGVGAIINDGKIDQRVRIRPDPAIADHHRAAIMADGDGGDFILHRTGISINIDNCHALTISHLGRLCIPCRRALILGWRDIRTFR